jgi:biopolymer transport protein ExbD
MAIGKLHEADIEGGEGGMFAEINITPLTDIFLVLLIIFMIGSTVEVQKLKKESEEVKTEASSGLKIQLPTGAQQEIDPGRASLIVGIQKGGQLIINGQAIPDKQLDRVFLSAFTTNNETQVVLKADQGVPHGTVVNVMERAKRVGLSRLAIATRGGG